MWTPSVSGAGLFALGAGGAVEPAAAGGFEAGEVGLPELVQRPGVALVLLVEAFDVLGVGAVDEVQPFRTFIELTTPSRRPAGRPWSGAGAHYLLNEF